MRIIADKTRWLLDFGFLMGLGGQSLSRFFKNQSQTSNILLIRTI